MAPGPTFLDVRGISKSFPGVVALDQVSLMVEPGQIHAVIGENGAGKSTLMKVLDGIYSPDAGEILLDGRPVRIPDPFVALELGISMVHQEPKLCNSLSISENVFMGRLPRAVVRGRRGPDTARGHGQARDALRFRRTSGSAPMRRRRR